jgi:hypothetical protein
VTGLSHSIFKVRHLNETQAFAGARERFGPMRKDGARKLRRNASSAAGMLWSLRDLQKE